MWNASVTLSVYWERSKVIFSGSYWTFNLILFEYCIRIIYSICFVIRVSCSIIHNHSIDTFFIFSHFVYNLIKNLKHAHPALPESISSQPRAAFKKDIHSFEIPSRNEFTYARAHRHQLQNLNEIIPHPTTLSPQALTRYYYTPSLNRITLSLSYYSSIVVPYLLPGINYKIRPSSRIPSLSLEPRLNHSRII